MNADLRVPKILQTAFAKSRWPRFLTTHQLRMLCPYVTNEEFELLQNQEAILGRNEIASLEFFRGIILGKLEQEERWQVTRGTSVGHSHDPEWLNLDFALILGGGAHMGDDKWLVMDFRWDNEDPRVIYNWYQHQDGKAYEGSDGYRITWRELAPSLSWLVKQVGIRRSLWSRLNPGF